MPVVLACCLSLIKHKSGRDSYTTALQWETLRSMVASDRMVLFPRCVHVSAILGMSFKQARYGEKDRFVCLHHVHLKVSHWKLIQTCNQNRNVTCTVCSIDGLV